MGRPLLRVQQSCCVLAMSGGVHRLGEQIRSVLSSVNVNDFDEAFSNQFTYFKESAIDVAGSLTRSHVSRELDGGLIVDVEFSRMLLWQPHLFQQIAEVRDLDCAR